MTDQARSELSEDELDRLLSALFDGTLGPDDERRLGERLASDAEVRRRYLEYVDLHAVLAAQGILEPPDRTATESSRAPSVPVPDRTSSGNARRVLAALGIAAAVVLPVAIARWLPRAGDEVVDGDGGREPVAVPDRSPERPGHTLRLLELQGPAELRSPSGDAVSVGVGAAVGKGQTLAIGADDGYAALGLPDGSRIELRADSLLRVVEDDADPNEVRSGAGSGWRFQLSSGLLRADVRPQPESRPLVVATPQAEVAVQGSRFHVSAVSAAATEVETESGSAQLTRLVDGIRIDVPAGSSALAVAARETAADPMSARPVRLRPDAPQVRCAFAGAHALAFSRDGTRLVAANHRDAAVLDAADGRMLEIPHADPLGHGNPVLAQDGSTLLRQPRDGRFRAEDVPAWTLRSTVGEEVDLHPGAAFALSADGTLAATCLSTKSSKRRFPLVVWQTRDGRVRTDFDTETQIAALAFSQDGTRLAAAQGWRYGTPLVRVLVQDLAANRRMAMLPVAPLVEVRLLAFSPDGSRLAAVTQRGAAFLWDVAAHELLAVRDVTEGWTRPVRTLTFSPDGRTLAAGTCDGRVRLWNVETGAESTLSVGTRIVSALAFSPDGRRLAVGVVNSNPVTIWDVPAETDDP